MIQRTGLAGKSWAIAGYDMHPSESELKKISRLNQFERIIVRIFLFEPALVVRFCECTRTLWRVVKRGHL